MTDCPRPIESTRPLVEFQLRFALSTFLPVSIRPIAITLGKEFLKIWRFVGKTPAGKGKTIIFVIVFIFVFVEQGSDDDKDKDEDKEVMAKQTCAPAKPFVFPSWLAVLSPQEVRFACPFSF